MGLSHMPSCVNMWGTCSGMDGTCGGVCEILCQRFFLRWVDLTPTTPRWGFGDEVDEKDCPRCGGACEFSKRNLFAYEKQTPTHIHTIEAKREIE